MGNKNTDALRNSLEFSKSLRVNFIRKIDSLSIASIQKIDILPPPDDNVDANRKYNGYRINVNNKYGKILYSRKIINPFIQVIESCNQDSEDIIQTKLINESEDLYSILIPDPDDLFTLDIKNKPYKKTSFPQESEKIFRFRIDSREIIPPKKLLETQFLKNENGEVLGHPIKLFTNRDESKCWNLIFLSEGYQNNSNDMSKFQTDVNKIVNYMKETTPFNEFWESINIYRLNIASAESCKRLSSEKNESDGSYVKSFFKASFFRENLPRLLTVDQNIVKSVLESFPNIAHEAIVLVNTDIYGGSGAFDEAPVISTSINTPPQITLHELGHSFFWLGDEYESEYDHGGAYHIEMFKNLIDESGLNNIPWKDSFKDGYIPASLNSICQRHNTSLFSHFNLHFDIKDDTIGIFEGGFYKNCGVFRSQKNCIMRDKKYHKFCVMCEQIIRDELNGFFLQKNIVS